MRKTFALMAALMSLSLASASEDDKGIKIGASLTEQYLTRYVKGSGIAVSEGPVIQDTLKVDLDIGRVGRFSGFGFMNHDLSAKKGPSGFNPNEIVLGTEHLFPINHKVSWRNGFMYGKFPEDILKKDSDFIFDSGLKLKFRAADLDLSYRHYLETKNYKSVDRATIGLSKTIPLSINIKDWRFSAVPNVRAVYQNNNSGVEGIHHLTFGANISAENPRWGFDLFINRQQGNPRLNRENLTYGGIRAKINF